ncbi:MAG: tRNA (guanosine(46)-N7)-methyltransferase TrmB [Verrucomicrobiales bacterium]|nr:tRNA (guanosine(46)-N7)-methyltransferase TrmB [Verrucomicrobiales bacterium]
MSNLKHNGRLRWAPSFLRNRGQVTRAQKRAMRDHWDRFGIRFRHGEIIDLDSHYEFKGPLIIEIGFGMGDHLVHLANSLPDHRVLGIEVHRPGLAAATGKAAAEDLKNLRLIRGDARLVLTDYLRESIATAIIIQFPDPWPKPGDEHRRLVQPDLLTIMHRTLIETGECLIATDVDLYAEHSRNVFSKDDRWQDLEKSKLQLHRINTLYESKAIEAGRVITEMCYQTR